jgi:hypothetical protein
MVHKLLDYRKVWVFVSCRPTNCQRHIIILTNGRDIFKTVDDCLWSAENNIGPSYWLRCCSSCFAQSRICINFLPESTAEFCSFRIYTKLTFELSFLVSVTVTNSPAILKELFKTLMAALISDFPRPPLGGVHPQSKLNTLQT